MATDISVTEVPLKRRMRCFDRRREDPGINVANSSSSEECQLDLLCTFAHRFPHLAAEILDRDQHKRRNFREETITDILMAGLVPFEPLGIRTDFPANESITGEDMDWEFVNEQATDGRRYLRLHIQAKRAISNNGKNPYWFYRELDHALLPPVTMATGGAPGASASPPPTKLYGLQHTVLVDEAAKTPGCMPIYMFYNPGASGEPRNGSLPAIEGVNWMFAEKISKKITTGHWPVSEKKVTTLRPHFHPLSKLLCFGRSEFLRFPANGGHGFAFIFDQPACPTPGEMCDRLIALRAPADDAAFELTPLDAVEEIPSMTLEAIRSAGDAGKRRPDIPRPRVIFNSGTI